LSISIYIYIYTHIYTHIYIWHFFDMFITVKCHMMEEIHVAHSTSNFIWNHDVLVCNLSGLVSSNRTNAVIYTFLLFGKTNKEIPILELQTV
jgi:hypothetical protein